VCSFCHCIFQAKLFSIECYLRRSSTRKAVVIKFLRRIPSSTRDSLIFPEKSRYSPVHAIIPFHYRITVAMWRIISFVIEKKTGKIFIELLDTPDKIFMPHEQLGKWILSFQQHIQMHTNVPVHPYIIRVLPWVIMGYELKRRNHKYTSGKGVRYSLQPDIAWTK
jgi:hypothetical protein